jgi:hypothetical protein
MGVVVVCEPVGTAASTTTALAVAASMPAGQPVLFAECDPTGGDVAAWAGLGETPGWATAIAAGDRSWAGLRGHVQELPSGLSMLCAPTHSHVARTVVRESAARFGGLLGAMSDVVTIADCGRVVDDPPAWARYASLVVLVVRQAASSSVGATAARVDRAAETLQRLHTAGDVRVGLVVAGDRPYDAAEVADSVGGELLGVLPEDPIGAGLVAGAWTIGRGAARSALAKAARPLAEAVLDATRAVDPLAVSGRSESTG